ncbi:MAG: hypothetical protein GF381_03075 [Candidatus Pacebacteria bacterium]|nr:hypothetical protein [Candidatus Paceibacterota bacterium]
MPSLLQTQIIATLAYSHLFQFPLTSAEISQRLIGAELIKQKFPQFASVRNPTQSEDIVLALNKLVLAGKVKRLNNHYFLAEGEAAWIKARQQKKLIFEQKLAQANQLVSFAQRLPWIKAVGLSGSVAVANADQNADIDFFIVTNRSGLWLSRLAVLLFSSMKGKRSIIGLGGQEDWCFNLWLGQGSALELNQVRRSLYTAYEACQVLWIYDPKGVRLQFAQANSWVAQFISGSIAASGADQDSIARSSTAKLVKSGQPIQKSGLLNVLNNLAYQLQKTWLRWKVGIPAQDLAMDKAVLHGPTYGQQLLARWHELTTRVLK